MESQNILKTKSDKENNTIKIEDKIEDKDSKEIKNSFKELDKLCEIKHNLDLCQIKINEKAINKVLKEKPFKVPVMYKKHKKDLKKEENEKEPKEEKEKKDFNCCKYYMFPSGINKTSLKNMLTGEETEEKIDYSGLDPKVYDKFKKNPTRELDILIGNTGYLFNTSRLMVSIVKKKISG